jgi:hypothetical protein
VQTGIADVKTTSLSAFASQLRSWRLQMSWTQVEMGSKLACFRLVRPRFPRPDTPDNE